MCFLPAVGAELGVGEGVVLCREARCKVAGMVVKCVIPNGKTFEAVSRNSALLALLFDPVIPRVTPSPTQSSVRCLSVLLLPAQSPPADSLQPQLASTEVCAKIQVLAEPPISGTGPWGG